jgi:hypothetical protein
MMTFQALRYRVEKLESIRAQKSQHVVIIFTGTPQTDANAERLVEEGRAEAERLGKELQVIRVRWKSDI